MAKNFISKILRMVFLSPYALLMKLLRILNGKNLESGIAQMLIQGWRKQKMVHFSSCTYTVDTELLNCQGFS